MSNDKIKCEVCGEEVHVMKVHIEKEHGVDSKNPITVEEYRAKYPDAPMLSEKAKSNIAAARAKKKISELEEERKNAKATMSKRPLNEVFDLGKDKDAFAKSTGQPLMIEYMDSHKDHEMIPMIDKNYVFDVELLKTALMGIAANIPTYLYGHAGVGKSSIVDQICARTQRPLVRLQHTINTEESHIVGAWTVKKSTDEKTGQSISLTVFELGPLPMAMKNGWVYLADEYDRGCPSVLSVYQAVLEGKSLFIKEADQENRIIKPHPNFRFVATGNTNGAGDESGLYAATLAQDAATFERFGIVQYVGYMKKEKEIAIVERQAGLVEEDAKDIVKFCESVRKEFPHKLSLTAGNRVAINIANIGLMKGDFKEGVKLSYANRLPEAQREAVMQIAQRIWG